MPAAVALFISEKIEEMDNFIVRHAKRRYTPVLDAALRLRVPFLAGAILLCHVLRLDGHATGLGVHSQPR